MSNPETTGPSTLPTLLMRRLQGEIVKVQKLDLEVDGIWAQPTSDITCWEAKVRGPPGSPYEGGEFKMTITFGTSYPMKPPKVLLKTRIYHCNFSSSGEICLNILQKDWAPSITVDKLLISIRSLMGDPNPDDSLVASIGTLLETDKEEHDRIARKWVQHYAMKKD